MPKLLNFKSKKKKINKPKHWILKIFNGDDFNNSKELGVWGISSKGTVNKTFIDEAQPGDKLWFMKSNHEIVGVAIYKSHTQRLVGPLISLTYSDQELGWKNMKKIDTQIDFENYIETHNLKYNFSFISDVTLNNQMNSYMNMEREYEKLL